MAQAQNTKKKQSNLTSDSLLEQLRGISSGAKSSVKNDLLKGGTQAAWKQFWGMEASDSPEIGSSSYEKMNPPEEVERKGPPKRGAYEVNQEFTLFTAEQRQTMQEVQVIRAELLQIIKTINKVDFEVKKAVMEIPVNPGVYHVNFLDRIKKSLVLLRKSLENSNLWKNISTSRKKSKGYWGMYKKKGTSFGLSNERTVATQTG